MVDPCKHLMQSPAAYRITAEGEERIRVLLCGWCMAPAAQALPSWLRSRAVAGGPLHDGDPPPECAGCPAYEARTEHDT